MTLGILEAALSEWQRVDDPAARIGSRVLTYSKLREQALDIAAWVERNTPSHSAVAVMVDDSWEWLPALVGIMVANRVVLPLEAENLDSAAELMRSAGSVGCLIDERQPVAGLLASQWASPGSIGRLVRTAARGSFIGWTTDVALRDYDPDVAYVSTSSGSTGPPKIIPGSSLGLEQFLLAECELLKNVGVSGAINTLRLAPATFDVFWRDILIPLVSGGTIALLGRFDDRRNAALLAERADHDDVHVLHIVPSLCRAVSKLLPLWQPRSLRAILLAGEPVTAVDVSPWIEHTSVKVVNVYGPSETTLAKFMHVVVDSDLATDRIPVGRVIPGAAAIALAPSGDVCYPGETGEIYISTSHKLHPYPDNPQLAARAFVANPLTCDDARLVFRTGDLGAFDSSGELVLVGRVDDMVKLAGQRVYLGEIERVVRTDPDIEECVVQLSGADSAEEPLLIAYVTTSSAEFDEERVLDRLSDVLAGPSLPQAMIRLDTLPRTSHGKVDRSKLPSTVPRRDAPGDSRQSYSGLALHITELINEILPAGVCIAPSDSFRAVGGQSLHAAQLSRRLDAEGMKVSIADIIRLRTPVRIAAAVTPSSDAERGDATRIRLLGREETVPLSLAQRRFTRLGRLKGLDHPSLRYCLILSIVGDISVGQLQKAVSRAVHEQDLHAIRLVDGRNGLAQALQYSDDFHLTQVPDVQSSAELHAWLLQWITEPFDFQRQGPLRIAVGKDTEGHLVFAMVGSVIWSDGLSKDALLRTISSEFASPGRPGKMASFLTYGRWEQQWLQGQEAAARLAHWQQHLPETLYPPFPAARADLDRFDQGHPYVAGVAVHDLSAVEVATVQQAVTAWDTTLIGHVFWAFAEALRVSCEAAPLIMFPDPNRLYEQEDRVYGCLTETLILNTANLPRDAASGSVVLAQLIAEGLSNSLPFEYVVGRLFPDIYKNGDFQESWWFPTMFAPQPDLDDSLVIGDADIRTIAGTEVFGAPPFPIMALPVVADGKIKLRVVVAGSFEGVPSPDELLANWLGILTRSGRDSTGWEPKGEY